MKKFTIVAAFCAAALLLTGCKDKTVAERETAAQTAIASGNLDDAKREIEKALRDAAKPDSGATQADRDRLNTMLADINRRIAERAINQEDDARAAVCRRHGADSVGNSGQREETEALLTCANMVVAGGGGSSGRRQRKLSGGNNPPSCGEIPPHAIVLCAGPGLVSPKPSMLAKATHEFARTLPIP